MIFAYNYRMQHAYTIPTIHVGIVCVNQTNNILITVTHNTEKKLLYNARQQVTHLTHQLYFILSFQISSSNSP